LPAPDVRRRRCPRSAGAPARSPRVLGTCRVAPQTRRRAARDTAQSAPGVRRRQTRPGQSTVEHGLPAAPSHALCGTSAPQAARPVLPNGARRIAALLRAALGLPDTYAAVALVVGSAHGSIAVGAGQRRPSLAWGASDGASLLRRRWGRRRS